MTLEELNEIADLLKTDYKNKKDEFEKFEKDMYKKYNRSYDDGWIESILDKEEKITYQLLQRKKNLSRDRYDKFIKREWKEI